MDGFGHIPVLLNEVLEALNILPGKKYIDATLGGGGHSFEILKRGGYVLGIDQDEDALEFVEKNLKPKTENLKLVKGNFKNIGQIAKENGFEKVDGILFDLGVSSYQLDNPMRGFSFRSSEKLDMRMDKGSTLSAYEVVNKYPYERLVDIFVRYGEEHNAKEIALNIVEARKRKMIQTPYELSSLIEKVGHKPEPINPSTRVFQAIRIEVNDELNSLKRGLEAAISLLNPGGRIAVISFHSLEDRIVKQTFARFERGNLGRVMTKKPTAASFEESKINKRARSAKMRVIEKLRIEN